jgi:DNA-binding MarR family transcriptional regulator
VTEDSIDRLLERWSSLQPGFDLEASQLVDRIARIALGMSRWQDEAFGPHGLNRGEVGVLSALRGTEAPQRLSPSRLHRLLMLTSAGITSRLDRLEQRGLITRVADPSDRRGVLIELTEKGQQFVDSAVAANSESQKQMLRELTEQDLHTLGRLLRKLQASVERQPVPG